jgi:hypothetical protein
VLMRLWVGSIRWRWIIKAVWWTRRHWLLE